MKAFFHLLGAGRIAALICCGVLAVAALFLKFAVPGYSFSALVCLCLIGIILFYTLFPLVGLKFPAFAKAVQTAVTVILAVGCWWSALRRGSSSMPASETRRSRWIMWWSWAPR